MKCARLSCSSDATVEATVNFWSGSQLRECLCDLHAQRLHDAMLPRPQVKSGSRRPLGPTVVPFPSATRQAPAAPLHGTGGAAPSHALPVSLFGRAK